ncbi:HYR domain-containing protein [Streptomyces sp. NRRL F-5727]|uniref:HYR domain-containing protein n=1 Tax=Streptomyces sp. NRRL F-5727 TaxID=1463871 RepID=UPI0004C62812|nr:HYR domain-containing protein [Streptomyces sp. NRRL F-5727]
MRWFQSSGRTGPTAPRRSGRRTSARAALALLLLAGAVPASTSALAVPVPVEPVTPASVAQALDPGASLAVDKRVRTPVVPPMPEVVLLVDGTFSMEPVIRDVRDGLSSIIQKVRSSQPDARFAVTTFGDQQVDPGAGFDVTAELTQDDATLRRGVDALGISRGNGSMGPSEDWINGLWQIANGAGGRTVFRENSSPVVVLVSDASSHNPSNGHTIEDTIFALQDKNARVLGIDVDTPVGDGLDGTGYAGIPGQIENPRTTPGQATRIIGATGGRKLSGIDPDRVAEAIVEGLGNLPTRVGHRLDACDPGLTVTLDPPTRDVVSGETAAFAETITVAPDAPQGATLTCTVEFLLGTQAPDTASIGAAAADPAYEQQISITVNDVTAPVVTVDDRTVRAGGLGGTPIDYTATAVDANDGPLTPTCTPASGFVFPVGTTTVTCTATDRAGNTASDTAVFRVLPRPSPPTGNPPPPETPPSADLAVSLSVAPARAYTGRAVVARYTLTNAGPDTAQHVTLDAGWPTGAGRGLTRTDRCTTAAPCTVPPGGRVVVTQTATYREAVSGTVRATAGGRLHDPEPGDNTATAPLRVLQPRLEVTPQVVRPGEPVTVRGTDFPPGERVRLVWSTGLTADTAPLTVGRDGRFEAQVLVLRKDRIGPRTLRAEVARLERLEEPVLVVPHALQPPDFAGRG